MTTPRKAPQDHKTPRDPKTFYWTSSNGVEIPVPKLGTIEGGVVRRTRKLEPTDQMYTIVEEALNPDQLAEFDALSLAEHNQMFRAWQEEAGIDVPQS